MQLICTYFTSKIKTFFRLTGSTVRLTLELQPHYGKKYVSAGLTIKCIFMVLYYTLVGEHRKSEKKLFLHIYMYIELTL